MATFAMATALAAAPIAAETGALRGLEAYDAGDSAAAARHWRRAAQDGSAYAMVALGALLEDGDGVAASPRQALHWYLRAAHAGDRHAMLLTGLALRDLGRAASARNWITRAAALGHPYATELQREHNRP